MTSLLPLTRRWRREPVTTRPAITHTDTPSPPGDSAEPFPVCTRSLGLLLVTCGVLGFAAAAVLTVEKFLLLTNPFYTPSCSVNATFSCGSVMTSPQAEVFGFPNPLLGIAGFTVVATTGAVLLAGGRMAGWYWTGLQVGVTAGVVFVHWLMVQSVYVIGALCPYCMVVWAVTIPTFYYVTLRNLAPLEPRLSGPARTVVGFVLRQHASVLAIWMLGVTAGIVSGVLIG